MQLKKQQFFTSVRLQYSLTYASIQGITVSSLVALHDTAHKHFDRRHLFVGVSRAIASDQLIVY